MSRFYTLSVTPQPGSPGASQNVSANPLPATTWTNKGANGAILGAQTIEFDIVNNGADNGVVTSGWVRIWGPSKQQISQASDFNGAKITLTAGMQPGLPLATALVNAGQAGVILQGTVLQAFGNWQGNVMTLDFIVYPDPASNAVNTTTAQAAWNNNQSPPPQNFAFKWTKGSSLTDNVKQVLNQVYPGITVNTTVGASNLTLQADEASNFKNLTQFAIFVKGFSQQLQGPGTTYLGINIAMVKNQLYIYDNITSTTAAPTGSAASATPTPAAAGPTSIGIQELIGQATWLDSVSIGFSTVLRGDLALCSQVTLPQLAALQAVTSASSDSYVRQQSNFNGTWMLTNAVRHVGNSRDPSPAAWMSIFQAVQMQSSTAPAAGSVNAAN